MDMWGLVSYEEEEHQERKDRHRREVFKREIE